MATYDIIGDIAILKFPEKTNLKEKKKEALKLLKEHKNIKTILEKADRVKGRLRISKTRFIAGKNTRETIYTESGARFKLNVDETYFSSRLSGERARVADYIAEKSKNNSRILVLFAGVAPFSIIIARKLKQEGKKAEIYSVEINRKASEYAFENVKLNKLENVEIIQKDVKKLKLEGKFDFIIMPRPQLRETFLKYIWKFTKKNTEIFYYDFGKDADLILEKIETEAQGKKKIKILEFRKAGDIAPYKYRWLVRFIVN
ncbi:methyltransferase domain-containing protein [Candidatus Pacearchaeota archaeon]|nr:methyltransferase domain-containing protein [Candidatus Pacearchaeota archaeon]